MFSKQLASQAITQSLPALQTFSLEFQTSALLLNLAEIFQGDLKLEEER